MRAVWRGALVVGEVSIPAELYKSAEHDDVSFRSVHRECGTPIKQSRHCPHCNVDVTSNDETARGYEFAEGQFVLVENDELDAVLGKTLALDRFVPDKDVPKLVGSTWWLSPGKDRYAQAAYAALTVAMARTKLAGVGRLAFYSKERVGAVRFVNGALALQALYTETEVRAHPAAGVTAVAAPPAAVALFSDVLRSRVPARFDFARLERTFPRRITRVIRAKVDGNRDVFVPAPEKAATRDLEATLTRMAKRTKRRRPVPA